MAERAMIEAEVVFLPNSEGGRSSFNIAFQNRIYRPHLVIGDPAKRRADATEEPYLGVAFTEGPTHFEPNQHINTTMELAYWPNVNYDTVIPGATFTIREGAHVVGFGKIIKRWSENLPEKT